MARTVVKKAAKKAAKKTRRNRKTTATRKPKSKPVDVQQLRERVQSVIVEKLDQMTEGVAGEASRDMWHG